MLSSTRIDSFDHPCDSQPALNTEILTPPRSGIWRHNCQVAMGLRHDCNCRLLDIAALVCAAMAVIPRVAEPGESLIFFGRIAAKDNWRYADAIRDASEAELLRDCAMQIHRNAQIACEKHMWVRRAMVASLLGALTCRPVLVRTAVRVRG